MKSALLLLLLLVASSPLYLRASKISLLPTPKYINYKLSDSIGYVNYKIDFSFYGTTALKYKEIIKELNPESTDSQQQLLHISCITSISTVKMNHILKKYDVSEAVSDSLGKQGFILIWEKGNISIFSFGERGVLYGLQSVKQIIRNNQFPESLIIVDWPNQKRRIFFDDISRGPIPTVESVKREIRQLAEMRYTDLSFYIEHVVKTKSYPDFAPEDGKFSIDDIKEICSYAKEYQMQVIGSFQSFGHYENILSHKQYASMGETASMISPVDDNAKTFLKSNIEELSDAFSSEYFNINCDETWDLEKGRSKDYVKKIGPQKFYADHIRFLYDILKKKGKKVMMWGDMAIKYPEIIGLLPSDIVFLTWNYDGKDYGPWIKPFASRHRKFIVCPGIVNSNRMFTDYPMTSDNLEFISQGYYNSDIGAMLTEWDDSCIHNFSSFALGVAMAAEKMWNINSSITEEDFKEAYCWNRFGTLNTSYIKTIDELMNLSNIASTFQMNSKFFTDRCVPEKGKTINVNIDDINKISSILSRTDSLFNKIDYKRNGEDIASLKYTLDAYNFACNSKAIIYKASQCYRNDSNFNEKRPQLLLCLNGIMALQVDLKALIKDYSSLWFAENQYYTYQHTMSILYEKEKELKMAEGDIEDAIKCIDSNQEIKPLDETSLNVRSVNSNYFCSWLFCGPFVNGHMDTDYLYDIGGENKITPLPGQRFQAENTDYKWTRFWSSDSFTMDFGNAFKSTNNSIGYAAAEIICDKEMTPTLLFGGSGEYIIMLNGKKIFHSNNENEFTVDKYPITLHLIKGPNTLIIKSRQLVNDWRFSARLDGDSTKAHKHKYYVE